MKLSVVIPAHNEEGLIKINGKAIEVIDYQRLKQISDTG